MLFSGLNPLTHESGTFMKMWAPKRPVRSIVATQSKLFVCTPGQLFVLYSWSIPSTRLASVEVLLTFPKMEKIYKHTQITDTQGCLWSPSRTKKTLPCPRDGVMTGWGWEWRQESSLHPAGRLRWCFCSWFACCVLIFSWFYMAWRGGNSFDL